MLTLRLATGTTVVEILELLLLLLGSVSVPETETLAVLPIVPVAEPLTTPLIVMMRDAPAGKVGMVPLTVLPETEVGGHTAPPEGLAQLAVIPEIFALMRSVKLAALAELGPALLICRV